MYLDRGYAKCFGCDKFVWNPLEVWGHICGITMTEALEEFRQLFGMRGLAASANAQLREWDRNQLLKRRISDLCHNALLNAIAKPNDPQYAYAQPAVRYLLQTRQLPVDALPTLPMIGVLPPTAEIVEALHTEAEEENERRRSESALKGEKPIPFDSLEQEAQKYLTNAAGWMGAVVFRLDTSPTTIGRFKLRRAGASSSSVIMLDDAFEEDPGFYGLGWELYKPFFGAQQKYSWPYVVEGEFDALSVMARQVQAGGPTFLVVSAGGSLGAQHIDDLHHFGFEECCLFADAPGPKHGEALIKQWLPTIKNMRTKVFTGWDQFRGSGDPDEAVVTHGLTAVQNALLDTKNQNFFQAPPDWVFGQAQPEIEAVPEEDLRHRIEIASGWGQLLKNTIDCDLFIQDCNKSCGIPSAILKREIVAKEEDEPAFILRVADVLSQLFHVLGQRAYDNDRKLYLWFKEKQTVIHISLADDASAERELNTMLGPSYQLFQEHIGIPPFLEASATQKAQGGHLQKKTKEYNWYIRQALFHMAQNAPDYSTADHKGQGIHVMRSTDGSPPTLYVVNGKDIFWGSFDDHGALKWKKLDGPAHNGIIFDITTGRRNEKAWAPWIVTTADLDAAASFDLQDIWNKLHRALDIGWYYKNHALTVDFLTAHLMATTINSVFRRQVVVGFHADTSSGKSRMVMGLIGGKQHPRIHLIASAMGLMSYSPAGVKQLMNNKTRPLCLDEFEDDGSGDKKARSVSEILDMFRGLTGEENDYTMGSRQNESVVYNLNFFIFIASINKARKVQDANRMLPVFMEKKAGHLDPQLILVNEFGTEGLETLKRQLSMALLPHAAKLIQTFDELELEYSKPGTRPAKIETRAFETLFPAMTIMKMLGKDYKKFVQDFCDANEETFGLVSTRTDSRELFDWLSQSPMLIHRDDGGNKDRANLLQLLATPETRAEITKCGMGLFWDEQDKVLVVSWPAAVQTILSNTRYAKETNMANMRELANRDPYAVKPEVLVKSPALARLRASGLGAVNPIYLTGYNLAPLIAMMGPQAVVQAESAPAVVKKQGVHAAPEPEKKVTDNGDFT
jgi:hypothetical protein